MINTSGIQTDQNLAPAETLAERAKLYNPVSTGVQAFHILRPITLAHIDPRDGAMSCLIGIAARKSIEQNRKVSIAELTDLKPVAVRGKLS